MSDRVLQGSHGEMSCKEVVRNEKGINKRQDEGGQR